MELLLLRSYSPKASMVSCNFRDKPCAAPLNCPGGITSLRSPAFPKENIGFQSGTVRASDGILRLKRFPEGNTFFFTRPIMRRKNSKGALHPYSGIPEKARAFNREWPWTK